MKDIEDAFLGSLIKRPDEMYNMANVSGDWFSGRHNKIIFESLKSLSSKGRSIDVVSVKDYLKSLSIEEDISGTVDEIMRSDFISANFLTYQARLEEEYLRKKVVEEMENSIVSLEKTEPGDIRNAVDKIESNIYRVSQSTESRTGIRTMGEIGIGVMKELKEIKEKGVAPYVANIGLIDIDNFLGGFKKGDYTILAGRPSMGKSAMLLQIFRNNIKEGRAVGLISLEMIGDLMYVRHLSAESGINSLDIRKGEFTSRQFDKMVLCWKKINDMEFHVDDRMPMDEAKVRATARRMVSNHDIKLLGIDFIQNVNCSIRRENRQQEMAKISGAIRDMAKELGLPVIAVSQLSRSSEHRQSPRPKLPDLRESGAIEQDADNVLFLYRPDYYGIDKFDDGSDTTGFAEFIVGKARNGKTGSIKIIFKKETGEFRDPNRGEDLSEENDHK
jgi:replicative DNA helicase